MRVHIKLLLSVALFGAGPAAAQTVPAAAMSGHPGMAMTASPAPAADASMMEAMQRMSQAMTNAPMTGDPDHDFVVMMIPHHQGAIDMAKFELQHGKDPGLRKLAGAIVAAQDKEIAEMRRWLARHPAK